MEFLRQTPSYKLETSNVPEYMCCCIHSCLYCNCDLNTTPSTNSVITLPNTQLPKPGINCFILRRETLPSLAYFFDLEPSSLATQGCDQVGRFMVRRGRMGRAAMDVVRPSGFRHSWGSPRDRLSKPGRADLDTQNRDRTWSTRPAIGGSI